MPSRRPGLSALLAVVALMVLLTALGSYRLTLSRRSLDNVHQAQLRLMARLQGQSALQELLAEVAGAVNRPGTRLQRKLRQVIDGDWEELDLTPVLEGPQIALVPRWGRRGSRAEPARGRGTIESFQARIRSASSSADPQGSEEWVGLLTLEVRVGMSDGAGSARRRLAESYEIRTVRAGTPRPFDQLGMFLGHLDAVTQAGEANRVRARLIARAAALRGELARLPTDGWPPEQADYLRRVAAGMPDGPTLEEATPGLPTQDSALLGFDHVDLVPLPALNLVTHWKQAEVHMGELERAFRDARGDPAATVAFAYQLASEYSNALDSAWGFQRVMTVMPRDGLRFQRQLGPALERLTPAWFQDRAHLEARPGDPDLAGWLAGRVRLEGVLDASPQAARLHLAAELAGRVVLLVGEAGARLEGVNREGYRRGNRLVVVSLGGDVEVRGRCGASVIMLGRAGAPAAAPGRLVIGSGATLHGSLLLPSSRGPSLDLEGALAPDAGELAPWPPSADLGLPLGGSYVVAISPEPRFREGEGL